MSSARNLEVWPQNAKNIPSNARKSLPSTEILLLLSWMA